jgi:hypothetical protein
MELSTTNYHFAGWATCPNLRCSDGRTIGNDAFKWQDGAIVPLVWNHQHDDPTNVVGQALLHSRDGGMYVYGMFNDSEYGQHAKSLVEDGTMRSLSIHANQLRHTNDRCVTHGKILEVSLVYSGANPKAFIETVIKHGEEMDDEGVIYAGEDIVLFHGEDVEETDETEDQEIEHADESKKEDNTVAEEAKKTEGTEDSRTVKEVFEGAMKKLDKDEQNAVYAVVGMALEDTGDEDADEDETEEVNHSEEGDETMKENAFDQNTKAEESVTLTHADQESIIALAKQSNVGSLRQAIKIYAEENDMLQHSEDGYGVFENYGVLFPELELLKKGEPETLYKYDQSWITPALAKIHKSPFSRIRTRHADARVAELKAKGYQKKGDQKTIMGQISMINRETTPQTIYIKDNLHRDDIIDITDFDIVAYQWKQMRRILDETMVLAAMVGDGREDDDPDKIKEGNIRPIWKDNEEYTIHYDVDIAKARQELQGTDTNAHFGENYIYAEAVLTAALYSREKFKGTGTPDFYCTPHLVNVMLLARDLNGRRIYDSKADLAKALNCNSIIEVEHFEGLVRETEGGDKKKLLGLFVNLNDYTFGSTRGGEITRFEDFDMDFNLKKFMLETRLSGSLYKLKSAIALEEPVAQG